MTPVTVDEVETIIWGAFLLLPLLLVGLLRWVVGRGAQDSPQELHQRRLIVGFLAVVFALVGTGALVRGIASVQLDMLLLATVLHASALVLGVWLMLIWRRSNVQSGLVVAYALLLCLAGVVYTAATFIWMGLNFEHPDDEFVNFIAPVLLPLHALMTAALIAFGWWYIERPDGDRRQLGHGRA